MAGSYYPTEYLNLNIARGLVKGTSNVHRYGTCPQINNAATATIWDVPTTLYPWSAFDTANTISIATTTKTDNVSTLDNGKRILIEGLDENFQPLSEEILISSSTGTGTKDFKRIFNAYVLNGGSSNLTRIKMSVNNTEVARIQIGKGQTLMSIYTIPANTTGYLLCGDATCQVGEGMTIEMYIRYFDTDDGVFRIAHEAEVAGDGGNYRYDFTIPQVIPEKSDIDVRAIARTNNIRASAIFDLILIRDNLEG